MIIVHNILKFLLKYILIITIGDMKSKLIARDELSATTEVWTKVLKCNLDDKYGTEIFKYYDIDGNELEEQPL